MVGLTNAVRNRFGLPMFVGLSESISRYTQFRHFGSLSTRNEREQRRRSSRIFGEARRAKTNVSRDSNGIDQVLWYNRRGIKRSISFYEFCKKTLGTKNFFSRATGLCCTRLQSTNLLVNKYKNHLHCMRHAHLKPWGKWGLKNGVQEIRVLTS